MRTPRVAYFPDSFHEVNGVAHTSRNFVAYAERRGLPLLCVRAGGANPAVERQGSDDALELERSFASVGVEKDLAFDPLFWRHADTIEAALRRFQPDVLHLTGPSELGIFAAYFAWKLGLPLAASWHTNVHQYAAQRLRWLTGRLPRALGSSSSRAVEAGALHLSQRLYARAGVLFAPNPELCDLLARSTGKPCHLMQRGVDTELFSPAWRTRSLEPAEFRLGFVGRLSIEKNVALLPVLERQLQAAGLRTRFVLIGHGVQQPTLRRAMPTAEFAGVLHGAALAQAYAEMDLLVFPSHTDTFGNVVLEALASGVPAIVTPDGGPRSIVRQGSGRDAGTGIVASDECFAPAIRALLSDLPRWRSMRAAAREFALNSSWDKVFCGVYQGYAELLEVRSEGFGARRKARGAG